MRIAAVLHVLFKMKVYDDMENSGPSTEQEQQSNEPNDPEILISTDAIQAAVNFVKVACQQTSFIAGKEGLQEEIKRLTSKGTVVNFIHMFILIYTHMVALNSRHTWASYILKIYLKVFKLKYILGNLSRRMTSYISHIPLQICYLDY